MKSTITIQMAQRGVVTLPKALRDKYDLRAGDIFTLLDLGGAFVLSPRKTEVDALADQISNSLFKSGETLESVLFHLREEREKYDAAD